VIRNLAMTKKWVDPLENRLQISPDEELKQ